MDPRIDEQHAVLLAALARIPVGGAKAINAASLDIDACDLGTVVCGEDRELDRATPGIRRENCTDVLVAWTPVSSPKPEPKPKKPTYAQKIKNKNKTKCVGWTSKLKICVLTLG